MIAALLDRDELQEILAEQGVALRHRWQDRDPRVIYPNSAGDDRRAGDHIPNDRAAGGVDPRGETAGQARAWGQTGVRGNGVGRRFSAILLLSARQ